MDKIYAIIILYDPDYSVVKESVSTLSPQVDKIVMVANSPIDCTQLDDAVEMIQLDENLGIAKAQNIGMESAFKEGADFVLQMDQDSIMPEGGVSQLLDAYHHYDGAQIGIVVPEHTESVEIEQERPEGQSPYELVPQAISSGALITKEVYEACGGMKESMFIDLVDFEYNWRCAAKGYLTLKNNNVVLAHSLGDGKRKVKGRKNKVTIHSPLRRYYFFRNYVSLLLVNYVPFKWKYYAGRELCIQFLLYPFILKDGFARLKLMLLGIFHGLIGRSGKL